MKGRVASRPFPVLLAILALAACVLPGCMNPAPTPQPTASLEGTLIPFETIERVKGNGSYEREEPGMVVIRNAAEAENIKGWISGEALYAVEQTDFQRQLVIAVFQGWKPVYDYEVEVQQVVAQNNKVVVDAIFIEPKPHAPQHPLESSPYQVIRLPKESLNGETKFILKANGQILTTTPAPAFTPTVQGVDLPFETVERAEISGAGDDYPANSPSLMVISRLEEAAALGDTISPSAQDELRKLDYNGDFAIIVFQGIKGCPASLKGNGTLPLH